MTDITLAEVIVSFVITWVIGLSPALVARYFVARKPLSRHTATWIAGISSVVFWMLFRIVNAAAGVDPQETTQGAVWIAVFIVSRWVMSRRYVETAEEQERRLQKEAESQAPPQRKLSRDEIIAGLEDMVSSSDTPSDKREWAQDRLARFRKGP